MIYRVYDKATPSLCVTLAVIPLCVSSIVLRSQQLANTTTIYKDVTVLKVSSIKRFIGPEGEEEIMELGQLDCVDGVYPLQCCSKANWRPH